MATQAERTAKMRARLLRATVRSLVQLGYTGTSTTEVCRRARVSRGAQLHHFPTKAQLVAAAVEQVFLDRMDEFQELVERVVRGGILNPRVLVNHLWSVYKNEAFYAWLELVVAARTDADLRKHVRAVDDRFTHRAEQLCAVALAAHTRAASDVTGLTRFVLSTLDGLAMHRILSDDERIASEALRFITRVGPR